jgi:hypothetical protein
MGKTVIEKGRVEALRLEGFNIKNPMIKTIIAGRGQSGNNIEWKITGTKKTASCHSMKMEDPFRNGLSTEIFYKETLHGVIIRRKIQNKTSCDIYIDEWSDLHGASVETGRDAVIYSVENCRVAFLRLITGGAVNNYPGRPQEFSTLINGKRYAEPLLDRKLCYGESEDQPFPAQVIIDGKKALITGLLSNEISDLAIVFEGISSSPYKQTVSINSKMFLRGQSSLLVKSRQTIWGETFYIGSAPTSDVSKALEAEYHGLLKKHIKGRSQAKRLSVFKDGRVWGSWNLGIYRDVTHSLLMKQSEIISRTRPDLKWVQIDEGYTSFEQPGIFILEEPGIDRKKFPGGMKAAADGIKSFGLKPAIWLGLIIKHDYEIPAFAKDWLLLDKNTGSPLILTKGSHFLDFSLKEVRDYFEKVISTVFLDWGYQGVKFDFWSNHFDCIDAAYRNPEFTGTMLRDWFWKTLRKYVGNDGFMLTCCCIGNGNPFIGRIADAFRCGIDIGHGGDWHGQVSTAFWYGMLSKFSVSRYMIPDLDSVGDFSEIINENMHRCWISFTCLSGAHLEYGGKLEKAGKFYGPKTIEAFNFSPLGQMGVPVDFPVPLQKNLAPMIWRNTSKDGKIIYIAVCNWDSKKKSSPFSIVPANAGITSFSGRKCVEFWTGKDFDVSEGKIDVPSIPKCDAMLFIIK